MSTIKSVTANVRTWDALDTIPEGFDQPDFDEPMPAELAELVEQLARVAATGGLAIVLPGRTPTQAVIVSIEGAGDGKYVEGSLAGDEE